MISKELGFILRGLPTRPHIFSVLTRTKGKIDVIFNINNNYQQIIPGMLFSSTLSSKKQKHFQAHNVEIILYPSLSDKNALYWFHHLLELSYFFIPPHSPNPETFSLMYKATCFLMHRNKYSQQHVQIIEKLFILTFLVDAGFYPEKKLIPLLNLFDEIVRTYVDLPPTEKVKFSTQGLDSCSSTTMNSLNKWIRKCTEEHPYRKLFKTIRFVDQA